jgi:hypothetical protein
LFGISDKSSEVLQSALERLRVSPQDALFGSGAFNIS